MPEGESLRIYIACREPGCKACVVQIMATNETAINIIDGLKGQHAQLRRLLAQRMWIKEASKATLAELENQIAQIKTVLLELEKEIQDQLKRVQ